MSAITNNIVVDQVSRWLKIAQEVYQNDTYVPDKGFPSFTNNERKALESTSRSGVSNVNYDFIVDRYLSGQSAESIHNSVVHLFDSKPGDSTEFSSDQKIKISLSVFFELALNPKTSSKYYEELLNLCSSGKPNKILVDTFMFPKNRALLTNMLAKSRINFSRLNGVNLLDKKAIIFLAKYSSLDFLIESSFAHQDIDSLNHIVNEVGDSSITDDIVLRCSREIDSTADFCRQALSDKLSISCYAEAMAYAISTSENKFISNLFSPKYAKICLYEIYHDVVPSPVSEVNINTFAILSVKNGADPYSTVLRRAYGKYKALEILQSERISDEKLIEIIVDSGRSVLNSVGFALLSISEAEIDRHRLSEECWQSLHKLTGESKYLSKIKSQSYIGRFFEDGLGL